MSATPQSQAIQVANQLMALSTELLGIYQQMVILDATWTDDNVANILAAMSTAAINADGTIGTVDVTPNAAHPINPATYPSLLRAVSSTQIAQVKTILDGVVNYVGGSAVTTQVGARAILNAVTGG